VADSAAESESSNYNTDPAHFALILQTNSTTNVTFDDFYIQVNRHDP